MKTTLAVICSLLMIAWTSFVPAASGAGAVHPGACCGCSLPVCCASGAPVSPAIPAAPAPSLSQQPLLPLAPPALAWTLPAPFARERSDAFTSPLPPAGAPLFARNCARLI